MRRTTINLTKATDRQIEYLKEQGYGSFTQIVRLAIDRMYRREMDNMKPKYKVVKADGKWNVIDGADGSFMGSFATKWEAEDFAAEMNEQDERQ